MGQHSNGGHSADAFAQGCYIPRGPAGGPLTVTVANIGTTANLGYRVQASNDRDFATATVITAAAVASQGLAVVLQTAAPAFKHYKVDVKSQSAGATCVYRIYGEVQNLNTDFWDH